MDTKHILLVVILTVCLLCISMWQNRSLHQRTYKAWKETPLHYGSHSPNRQCTGGKSQIEDLLCLERPKFLPDYKNPCWYSDEPGKRELRCLPYYHILGVSKSGTHDLSSRIRAHDDVLGCELQGGKSMYYWSNGRYGLTRQLGHRQPCNFSCYTRGFPAQLIEENVTSTNFHNKITGDGTPVDFYNFLRWKMIPQNAGLKEPVVLKPHLMKHMYKDPNFIIILRNPTERLYSDYIFLKHGDSPQSFHKDVQRAIQIEEDCMRNNSLRWCLYSLDVSRKLPTRIFIGYYSVFMKEWLNVFSRNHFLILRTEDYNNDMEGALREVYDFLKLSYTEDFLNKVAHIPHMHVTEEKKKAGAMLKETRILLDNLYRPYLNELADILQDKKFLWFT